MQGILITHAHYKCFVEILNLFIDISFVDLTKIRPAHNVCGRGEEKACGNICELLEVDRPV